MKKLFLSIGILLLLLQAQAQQREINYEASLSGFVSTERSLPFWQIANHRGLIPDGRGAMLYLGAYSDFTDRHKIQFAYGISAAGSLSDGRDKIILDQLHVSGRWRNLRLDLGMIHPETAYHGISSTNGNIIRSGNSRTFPGYNLSSRFMKVPFTRGILQVKFNWADYLMIDDCYVEDTRLHNKSAFLKITPHPRWEIIVGLEHWAQWAGTSPIYGKQPSSFKDYLRIIAAQEGGAGASTSDSINALGNHLGREHLSVNYHADNYTLTFYHDIPFEDASGTDFRSFPDGVYALYYTSRDRSRWITDVIYEFYYTKYQSGSRHDRPATPEEIAEQDPNDPFYGRKVLGGCDNYFNNGEYRSGWTLYRRTIGTPLFTAAKGDGRGVINNRLIAHHLGIAGTAFRDIPYRAMLTYSINYGTYSRKLPHSARQLSAAIEATLPFRHLPFRVDAGLYADLGSFLPDNFGLTLSFRLFGNLKL